MVAENRSGGKGSDLLTTQNLIELFGREMELSSKTGGETARTVTIPFEVSMKSPGYRKNDDCPLLHRETHILIAEDNDISRRFIERILERKKIPFVSFKGGREAIDILKQKVFDIALTASTSSAEKEKAISVAMNHHISKPVTPDSLLQTIDQLLSEKEGCFVENDHIDLPDGLDKEEILELCGGEWDFVSAVLHKIKPSFKMVGFGKIEKQAGVIEELCKLTPRDETDVTRKLAQLMGHIREEISSFRKGLEVIINH